MSESREKLLKAAKEAQRQQEMLCQSMAAKHEVEMDVCVTGGGEEDMIQILRSVAQARG